MKSNKANRVQTIIAHVVLIFLSFLCLFFFYILIVNATRSHADLQKGFSAIPGTYFLENLKNVAMTEVSRCSGDSQQSDRIDMFSGSVYIFFIADSVWSVCI